MNEELAGTIEFCMTCKRLIDYALITEHKHRLYIQIDKEVPAPDNRIIIPLCETCQNMLEEHVGDLDGFIIEIPQ
jgi:hypothetical protein